MPNYRMNSPSAALPHTKLGDAREYPGKRNLTLTNANRKRQQNLAKKAEEEAHRRLIDEGKAELEAKAEAQRAMHRRLIDEGKADKEAKAEAKRVMYERFAAENKLRKEKQEAYKRAMTVNLYEQKNASSAQQYTANNLRRRKNRTRKHRR